MFGVKTEHGGLDNMTARTHRAFAVSWAFVGAMILYTSGLMTVNYWLSAFIMLQVSKVGGLFPDVDHDWSNVKDKTLPNFLINKIIHISNGKHRSWQTHSIDICLLFVILTFIGPNMLMGWNIISATDVTLLALIMCGFSLGWLSHIFADMLTSAGVRVLCWKTKKIALVPRKFLWIEMKTGDDWEEFVYKITRISNIVIGVMCFVYPFIVKVEAYDKYTKAITDISNTLGRVADLMR